MDLSYALSGDGSEEIPDVGEQQCNRWKRWQIIFVPWTLIGGLKEAWS